MLVKVFIEKHTPFNTEAAFYHLDNPLLLVRDVEDCSWFHFQGDLEDRVLRDVTRQAGIPAALIRQL
jgi:hypothetical protein